MLFRRGIISILPFFQPARMHYLFGVSLSLFLCLILLSKSGKTIADKVLVVWLLFIALHIFLYYISRDGNWVNYEHLLGIAAPFPLLHGPLLYEYTAALIGRLPAKKWTLLLHLLPAITAYVALIPFFMLPAAKKLDMETYLTEPMFTLNTVLRIMISVSGVVYVVWSLWLLKQHRKKIVQEFSYTDKINLRWLQYLIYGVGFVWVAVIIGNNTLIYSLGVLLVVFIGYYGIKQVGIFTQQQPIIQTATNISAASSGIFPAQGDEISETEESPGEEKEPHQKKYRKSGVSEADERDIHHRLIWLMEEKAVYRDPEITLAQLAAMLNVHPNSLSQVINSQEQKTFYDYINELRINDFKYRIQQPENSRFTLLALALECGFNSKTTFNRNFKKVTGISPSEYLQTIRPTPNS